ncbi:MAG: spore maturation protein [Ruminococcus sp.]|nr:spore maturation protein [Ruminococcus sp.]
MQMIVPVIILLTMTAAKIKKVDIAESFCEGARDNLILAFELCPMLIFLMTAVSMFTGSGAADHISSAAAPLTERLGFPKECLPLALVRPISGSASLSLLDKLLSEVSPDSFAGRTASVMMGATETTLYTITLYYSSVKTRPDPKVFVCSFAADITGFIFAPLIVRLFFK